MKNILHLSKLNDPHNYIELGKIDGVLHIALSSEKTIDGIPIFCYASRSLSKNEAVLVAQKLLLYSGKKFNIDL